MTMVIKQATKKQARARIALCGPSGAGKTMSALKLAGGLVAPGGVIGVIDTERRSAALYADVVPFVTIELGPPYSPERYRQAIEALEKHGCEVIIIDQISHEWSGQGGMLEMVDALQATGKNKMQAWARYSPMHQQFIDALLASTSHIIATMRSKTEWQIDHTGKPKKIGLAPVQRDGIEFEFTAVIDLDEGHGAVASKDRTRVFGEVRFTIDENWGRKLAEWLSQGAAYEPEAKAPLPPGTYVKPSDYVEPPDPMPVITKELDDMAAGFDNEPATEPLVSDDQIVKLTEAAEARAKALGQKTQKAVREIIVGVLTELEVNPPERKYMAARHFDAALDLIAHWS